MFDLWELDQCRVCLCCGIWRCFVSQHMDKWALTLCTSSHYQSDIVDCIFIFWMFLFGFIFVMLLCGYLAHMLGWCVLVTSTSGERQGAQTVKDVHYQSCEVCLNLLIGMLRQLDGTRHFSDAWTVTSVPSATAQPSLDLLNHLDIKGYKDCQPRVVWVL